MTAFIGLLQIYKWALPASAITAATLSLIGSQWTARGKSSQIFVLGQGSSLGIILGLAINILLDADFHGISLALGISLGLFTLLISDLAITTKSDRNHIYLTIFVLFMSLSYLVTSTTPSLESHVAAAYFGDIAVMSDFAAQSCLLLGILFGGFVLSQWKNLSLISFQLINQSAINKTIKNRVFDLGTLLITTMAIQNMGYLYTMGSLFIGTTFAAHKCPNLKSYTRKVIFISTLGSSLGFLLSLSSTTLPTVPCILLGQVFMGIMLYTKK